MLPNTAEPECNVRELENAVEHAFVMCQGSEITAEDLPATIGRPAEGRALRPECASCQGERDRIVGALQRHLGNRSRAAEDLHMHRTTLWRKMKTYGLA